MQLKCATSDEIIIRRHSKTGTKIGGIFLPDEYLGGFDGATSLDRYCDVLAVPESETRFKEGDVVVIRENYQRNFPLIEKAAKAPSQFVLAVKEGDTLRMLGDHVLIKADPAPEKHHNSILFIAEEYRADFGGKATVLAVGPDTKEVKVGHRIMFHEFAGLRLFTELDGEVIILKETPLPNHNYFDIYGIVENE